MHVSVVVQASLQGSFAAWPKVHVNSKPVATGQNNVHVKMCAGTQAASTSKGETCWGVLQSDEKGGARMQAPLMQVSSAVQAPLQGSTAE